MDAILFFQRFTAVFVHCPERDSKEMLQGLVGAFLAFPEFPRSFPDPLRGSSGASLHLRAPLRRRSGTVGSLLGRLSWRSLRGLAEVSRTPLKILVSPPTALWTKGDKGTELGQVPNRKIIKYSLRPTLRMGFWFREDRCLM